MRYWVKMVMFPLVIAGMMAVLLTGCNPKEQGTSTTPPPVVNTSAPSESQEEPIPEYTAAPPPVSTSAPSVPPEETGHTSPVSTPAPSAPPKEGALSVTSMEELQKELYDAICGLRQPVKMDVSKLALGETPDLEVKNLYYQLLSQNPEIKYAYDLTASVKDGLLMCQVSYMPYKTGDYPAEWQGVSVGSMGELVEVAEAHIGEETVPIRLTDTSLAPDNMSRVLQQVGGGYILCALNRDGTQLTYTPAWGMTMEECLSLLREADDLAKEVVGQVVTESMSERERAEALYDYLTHTVSYDQRYYSDLNNMPYDSRTAIGALRDGTAICGGYSNALKLLFEHSGIPCYTVTGVSRGEHHMWNTALIDGQWLWFDATADRTKSPQYKLRHFAQEKLGEEYVWDQSQLPTEYLKDK